MQQSNGTADCACKEHNLSLLLVSLKLLLLWQPPFCGCAAPQH
jgi:hypothetical protein